jgi:hypothetical protein
LKKKKRMPCTVLRCCWSNIIFWNPPAPTDGESDGSKDKFHKEMEQMFHQLPAYYMNIVLRDQDKGRERRFGNASSHKSRRYLGVRIVNFATSENLIVERIVPLHRNIHQYTLDVPDWQIHSQIDHI